MGALSRGGSGAVTASLPSNLTPKIARYFANWRGLMAPTGASGRPASEQARSGGSRGSHPQRQKGDQAVLERHYQGALERFPSDALQRQMVRSLGRHFGNHHVQRVVAPPAPQAPPTQTQSEQACPSSSAVD
jgi:hypothetical protein